MSEPLVRVSLQKPAGTIILNRPEKRNALSRAMLGELMQAFEDMHAEKSVRAVILTGAGTSFCSGLDLDELHATSQEDSPHEQWHKDVVRVRELLEMMLRFPKPIIAAVNGPAIAGGAGLVLASDMVVSTSDAPFGIPGPRRGLVAGVIAPLLMFRLSGSHAARLLLTAEPIEAAEAHRIGIYQELVAADHVWARAAELANQCAKSAPEALQLTKRLLNEMIGEHLGHWFSDGTAATATSMTTESAAEGLAAFVEKRAPNWVR